MKPWVTDVNVGGKYGMGKNQWKAAGRGVDLDHRHIMFDTDMCLAYTTKYSFVDGYELLASNGECCGWSRDDLLTKVGIIVPGRGD